MARHLRNILLVLAVCIAVACGSHSNDGSVIRSQEQPVTTNSALFVVGSTTLGAGDAAVSARLVALGFTVTVLQDSVAQATDATGKQLVVISSTVTSGNVGSKFTSVAVPVLVWESAVLDDLGMTTAANEGTTLSQTQLKFGPLVPNVFDPATDFMTAGLTGTVPFTVTSSAQSFSWGAPGANAVSVATLATDATKSVIFRYEKGAGMVVGTAPERRLGFFLENTTASALNAAGQSLFDAAVRWASHNDFPTVGLQLRFEADAAQMVTANGRVTTWKDQSPNKLDLNLGFATFASSVPSVVFDQSQNMRSSLAKIGSLDGGMTLVMMVMAPRSAGANVFVDMSEDLHASVYDSQSPDKLSASYSTSNTANNTGGTHEWPRIANPGSWQIVQLSQNGITGTRIETGNSIQDSMIHVNGNAGSLTSEVPIPDPELKSLQIGSVGAATPTHVRAIFLYNRVLSSTERVGLQNYLNARWPAGTGAASCFDGIANQDEVGIDCGGTQCAACAQQALLVVGNTTLGAGDAAIQQRLLNLGFTVTVVKDSTALATDATGKQLVVISSTVASSSVNTKFTAVTVPVVNWESAVMDDLGMTTMTTTDFGTATGQTQLAMAVGSTDTMAAGLTGTQTVTSAATTFTWGKPGAAATIVARLQSDATKSAIFRYENGATMPGRVAPERRVGIFLEDTTATVLTTAGAALADAAIRWAAHLDRKPIGSTCSSGSACLSGFCADGVCCDTACTDGCMTCGSGICTATPAHQPDGACKACDGFGSCPTFPGSTSEILIRYEADPSTMVLSGNAISTWKDQSQNHWDLVGSATFEPSLPAVIFDNNQQIRANSAMLGSFNFGITIVVFASAPNGAERASFFVDMSEYINLSIFGERASPLLTASYSASTLSVAGIFQWPDTVGSGAGNWQIVQVSQFTTNTVGPYRDSELFVNGVGTVITGDVPVPNPSSKQLQLGSVGGVSPIAVRAVFIYDRPLTVAERDQLRIYLQNRWPVAASSGGCFNGSQDPGETGTDCGGPCKACPTCNDTVLNQGETGHAVTGGECGGPNCPACASCFDGIPNGNETGTDCGGECVPCCENGKLDEGEQFADCGGVCPKSCCQNHRFDQGESATDCGGSCPSCCLNNVQDNGETGLNCGGGGCPACPDPCTNGIQDLGEKGVDCGGPCSHHCFTEVLDVLQVCTGCHSKGLQRGGLSLATDKRPAQGTPLTSCQSDAVCTPLGLVCDLASHVCKVNLPYTDLINHATSSSGCGTTKSRIVPNSLTTSVLYSKVHDTTPLCGPRMPTSSGGLTDDQQRMIETWITGGAKDN